MSDISAFVRINAIAVIAPVLALLVATTGANAQALAGGSTGSGNTLLATSGKGTSAGSSAHHTTTTVMISAPVHIPLPHVPSLADDSTVTSSGQHSLSNPILSVPGDVANPAAHAQGDRETSAGTSLSSLLSATPASPRSGAVDTVTNSLAGPVRNAVSPIANGSTRTGNTSGAPRSGNSPYQADGTVRSGVPPVGEHRYVPNEVVIALPTGSRSAMQDLARQHQLTLIESQDVGLLGTSYYRTRIGDGRDVADVIRALEADGAVRTAQPNYRFTLQEQPQPSSLAADPAAGQYVLDKLHVAEAHRVATGTGVLVAVIDSGIDASHSELADAVADRYDLVTPVGGPHRHGTAMAGAIAAHGRMTGIAPRARLLAVRAFSGQGDGLEATTLRIIKGIDWAMARGARVINMSFAGPYDPNLEQALAAARQKGAVLVAAAGNAGPKSSPLYPAADKNVIAVTATDAHDELLSAANRGQFVAVAAPGVDIVVPSPGQRYELSTGTSVAAAHVSGVVALLLELRPKLTPDEVRHILQSTSMDLGPKGCDDQYGCGLVDARRAALSLAPNAAAPSTTAPNMARSKPTLLFSDRWPDARTLSPPLIDRRQQSAAANPFAEKTSLTSAGLD